MEKEKFIHVIQTNGKERWINPRHIITFTVFTSDVIELVLTNSQISDISKSDPTNKELIDYIFEKKVL